MSVGSTATRTAETEVASDGTPHTPATGKVRWMFAASAGKAVRVSTTRHGATVK